MSKGKKIQPVRKSPRKRSAPSYQESPDQSDIEVDELEVSSYSQGWDDGSTEEEDEQRPVSASLVTETTVKFNPEQEETWILDTVGPPELKTCKVCGESCSSRASKMKHQKCLGSNRPISRSSTTFSGLLGVSGMRNLESAGRN